MVNMKEHAHEEFISGREEGTCIQIYKMHSRKWKQHLMRLRHSFSELPTMIFQQITCWNKILCWNDLEKEAYWNIRNGKDSSRK